MELERILGTDKGKEAFYKSDRNFQKIIGEQETIQTQTILENYLSTHNIPASAKRGKLDVKMKGMTAENIIDNGDFSDGVTGWYTSDSTQSVVNNLNTVTGNGIGEFPRVIRNTGIRCSSWDKVYLKAKVKVNESGALKICYIMSAAIIDTVISPIANTYYNVGQIYTPISTGNYKFGIGVTYADATTALNKTFTITDTMLINLTQLFGAGNEPTLEQCDLMFANYIDGLQGVSNIRVLNTGKNLFNKNKAILNKRVLGADGSEEVFVGRFVSDFIPIKPNQNYFVNYSDSGRTQCYYDINKKYIGYETSVGLLTPPTNSAYVRISYATVDVSNIQLEEGTVVTPYEPYTVTENTYKTLDGQPITLHGLQNGAYDEKTEDGKYIKRIAEKVLTTGDIPSMCTSASNLDFVRVSKPLDYVGYGYSSVSHKGCSLLEGYVESTLSDVEGNIGTYNTNSENTYFFVGFTKGTSLATAQTSLVGKKLIYELAQPRILETNAVPLIAEPNGHVFISSDGCIPSNELSYPLNLGAVVDGLIDGQKENSNLLDKFGNQINNLVENGGSNKLLENNTDLNTLIIPGFYRIGINAAQGDVPAGTYFMIINRQSTIITQMFIVVNSNFTTAGEILTRISGDSGANWTAIKKMVTTTPNDWITATLQNGWTGTLQYRKNQIGQLEVIGNNLTAGTVTLNTLVSNLPSGYRPIGYTVISAFDAVTGKNINAPLALDSNGSVRLLADGLSSSLRLYFDIVCA